MNYLSSLSTLILHPENKGKTISTIGRIVWWKLNQLFFKLPIMYQLTKTTTIICEPESSYGSYVVYARFPEHDEMTFIHSYLKENDIMIDVGANIGAVSLVAADKITKGQIYSFEPSPLVAKKLEANIRINKLEDRVCCISKAVSNKKGNLDFILEQSSEISHLATKKERNGTVSIKVPSITLDSFIAARHIKNVNLLKIDVEGAELSVFKGSLKSLKKHLIDVIVFEVNPKMHMYGTTSSELLSYLLKFDYAVYQFSKLGRLVAISNDQKVNETINLVAISPLSKVKKRLKVFLE